MNTHTHIYIYSIYIYVYIIYIYIGIVIYVSSDGVIYFHFVLLCIPLSQRCLRYASLREMAEAAKKKEVRLGPGYLCLINGFVRYLGGTYHSI